MILKNKEARIELTNDCNLRCVMCPREKLTREDGYMSQENFELILDKLKASGVEKVVLNGFGEPFLDIELPLKIQAATCRGLKTFVTTNCTLFNMPSYDGERNRIQAAAEAGLGELRLSFYGSNTKDYAKVMRSNFWHAIGNLKLLAECKGDMIVSHSILDFDGTASHEDYPQELQDVVDYYDIWKPHNFGDGRTFREVDGEKQSCQRPQSGPLQIDWDGTIVPCCYDYNNEMVLGNILHQSIEEIMKGEAYEKLRAAHEANDYSEYPYCDKCDQLQCNKFENSIVKTTNPKHRGLSAEEIVQRTNSSAEKKI